MNAINFAMNKYIEQGIACSPAEGKTSMFPSKFRKATRPIHVESQILRKEKSLPPQYLQSQFVSCYSESPVKHQKKVTLMPMEPIAVRKIKQQLRYKRKKLIIEDSIDNQLQQQSNNMVMSKSQDIESGNKLKLFSSQKKTTIVHAFQVSALPKKSVVVEKKTSFEEERRCELINSILQRYKLKEKSDDPEKGGSPSISTLKLNNRSYTEPKQTISPQKVKECELVKFQGFKGDHPRKITKKLVSKRIKSQSREGSPSPKKNPIFLQEITPWQTDELLI